jgi:site-specific DNA recombinase
MRAIVYSRVSTDAQERDGTSLDTQERACVDLAEQNGWLVTDMVRDTASGFTLDRPGIQRLLRLLRESAADAVVAYAVDRLARDQVKLAVLVYEIQQADARLEFVTEKFEDTAVGMLILNVRGFAAQVEREKIAERTMRGKLECARSGRIPQGMGRGTYGYVYNSASGQRDIDTVQAEVVRRIFERYAETRSFASIANELNDSSITALQGGRWHPLTIRRMLGNESNVGRLFFGKTKWSASRSTTNGQRRRRPTPRAEDEWIEIRAASPRLVDEELWQRVQVILADPERVARRPKPRYSYPLRGRIKCGLCSSAMVGQTMQTKTKAFHYYVCCVAFDPRQDKSCTARNVRADKLEAAIQHEIRTVLTNPTLVLREMEQQREAEVDHAEIVRLEQKLGTLRDSEQRLVRLYTSGRIDDDVFDTESAVLKRERTIVDDRLKSLRPVSSAMRVINKDELEQVCAKISVWLDGASDENRTLVLEALQIAIRATPNSLELSGVLPADAPGYLQKNNHADARFPVINRVRLKAFRFDSRST